MIIISVAHISHSRHIRAKSSPVN